MVQMDDRNERENNAGLRIIALESENVYMRAERKILLIFYLLVIADNLFALHGLITNSIYSVKIVGLIMLRLLIVACFISLVLRKTLMRKE